MADKFFDRKGNPITLDEYRRLMREDRVLAGDKLPDKRYLSTMFLSVPVGEDESGRPLIYESTLMPQEWNPPAASGRYATEEEALAGHKKILELLNAVRSRDREPPESSLTFSGLRCANLARANQSYHPGPYGICEWSVTDWATAVGGECGEALNVVKKIRREIDQAGQAKIVAGETAAGWNARRHRVYELRGKLADELADLILYADLLAAHQGIDLGAAIVRKFNAVSEKIGSEHRL